VSGRNQRFASIKPHVAPRSGGCDPAGPTNAVVRELNKGQNMVLLAMGSARYQLT